MRRGPTRQTVAAAAVVMTMVWMMPPAVCAQDGAASAPTKPQAMARNANPGWEVATVKISDPNDARGQHIRMHGRYIMLLDTTVEEFLLLGYGVQKSQLAGLPEWAKTEKWDVNGVPDAEGEPSWNQLQEMMRGVLAERFGAEAAP